MATDRIKYSYATAKTLMKKLDAQVDSLAKMSSDATKQADYFSGKWEGSAAEQMKKKLAEWKAENEKIKKELASIKTDMQADYNKLYDADNKFKIK